jgi:hypothetical protein
VKAKTQILATCWQPKAANKRRRLTSAKAGVHRRDGEIAAGADGAARVDLTMDNETHRRFQHGAFEIINQRNKRAELGGRGFGLFVISDAANANADLVHVFIMNMATLELIQPPAADLDLAVTGLRAVADDEMIGEAMLHSAQPVGAIIDRCVAGTDSTVVADDDLPPTGYNRKRAG